MSLTNLNPEGSTPPYRDLFSNVTIVPPGAKLAYISSQWACDNTGQLVEGGKGNHYLQAKQTWQNAFIILKGLGCTMKDVIHRGNSHYEFSEEIAKKCIEGSIEACPPEQLEYFFKSSCSYSGCAQPHLPDILYMLDLVVVIPT